MVGCGLEEELNNDPTRTSLTTKDPGSLGIKRIKKSPGSSCFGFEPIKIIPIFTWEISLSG